MPTRSSDPRHFVQQLELADPRVVSHLSGHEITPKEQDTEAGYVNAGSLVSFVAGVSGQHRSDVLNSALLAQLAASKQYDRETQVRDWYRFYVDVLSNIGWPFQDFRFTEISLRQDSFKIDEVLLKVLEAVLSQDEIRTMKASLDALAALSDSDGRLVVFERESHSAREGNFQLSTATEENGVVSLAGSVFFFSTSLNVTRILWTTFTDANLDIYGSAFRVNLDEDVYAIVREDIVEKLGDNAKKYVGDLDI
ncbi:hypothetical protein HEP86_05760 [Streptomyces sp. RPA4-5]|uniref:hypothetical protein n=1 Tax=unclassified Streptomyces TaxID=2593676 RepID=UPI00143EBA4B|nr:MULTISPECIES: hypothetical protein [unclassified Streptomyces]QIY54100.1 hypothetical protein HEP86_05760 [Streptomyces sp. RPA4-5]WJY36677.1 hypothetical protein QT196_04960 [Streptomyces sp. P9-2B-2]